MKRSQPHARCVAAICKLVDSIGGKAYQTHQGAGPRRRNGYQGLNATPGLPDLYILLPKRKDGPDGWPRVWWWEVKVGRDTLRPAQREFVDAHNGRRIPCGVGDLDEFRLWLKDDGYLV